MQHYQIYSPNELMALVAAVLMGTGAYLGFMVVKKQQKVGLAFIVWVLLINLFVTNLFSEALKIFKWGSMRTLILPLVAFGGQYLLDWLDRRYLKIFDAAAKKAGLDINENNNHDETDNNPEGGNP